MTRLSAPIAAIVLHLNPITNNDKSSFYSKYLLGVTNCAKCGRVYPSLPALSPAGAAKRIRWD